MVSNGRVGRPTKLEAKAMENMELIEAEQFGEDIEAMERSFKYANSRPKNVLTSFPSLTQLFVGE